MMNRVKYSKEIESLLLDPSFVFWCLTPTEELDLKWQKWMDEHPEGLNDLYRAKEIVASVKFNTVSLPHSWIDQSFSRLESKMIKRKRSRQLRLYLSSAAAVVSLFLLGIWMVDRTPLSPIAEDRLLHLEIEQRQTEIELLTPQQGKIELTNQASIHQESEKIVVMEGGNKKVVEWGGPVAKQDSAVVLSDAKVVEPQNNVLKVPAGRRASLVLEDGTEVWVNSGTILAFPSKFDQESRTIYVNGEVFLRVAKETNRPFIVKTTEIEVKVLGTSFNLSAYSDDSSQSVVLVSGSVEVNTKRGDVCKIKPGEMALVDSDGVTSNGVDVYKYTSWKDGILYFERATLDELLKRIARHYRVGLKASSENKDLRCSGKLVLFNDIDSVMTTLKSIFPVAHIEQPVRNNSVNNN